MGFQMATIHTLMSSKAEYHAMLAAAQNFVFVENMNQEIGTDILQGVIYCNNEAVVHLLRTNRMDHSPSTF